MAQRQRHFAEEEEYALSPTSRCDSSASASLPPPSLTSFASPCPPRCCVCSARSLYLPAKPASAPDETLPLVQALVGIALEMASEEDGGGGGGSSSAAHLRVIPGSVEAELEKQKESQRLMSLYKLFPAMLDVVAVEGFKPDRISDISALTEMAIQRFTQDMDHAIALLTEPHTAATSTPNSGTSSPTSSSLAPPRVVVGGGDDAGGGVSAQPCNPRGFHTECWQFLTILSRLLLFDSVDVIAPAATSHLPTALILFIGKLQGKLSERRAGVKASASTSLPFAPPVVTALDIPSIHLHPYTTASTTFEQLHSQVFGMLYIMCKHESALYDVMYGGHLRTLFSVFINAPVCEAAFHDETPDSAAPAIWAAEGQRLTSDLHFLATSSFRAGVMMVMNGVMKEHPQDGLDYMQVHDLISMMLNAIAAPYPPPRPAASQEPDPALEVVVDCVRLLMLVLRTAVKHAPTTTYYPPQLSQKTIASVAAQTQPSASSFTSPPAALPYTSPPPTPQSSSLATTQPLPGSSSALPPSAAMATGAARPLHTSASANSVASSLSVPPDLFTPLPQATCPLLEEFELSNGYDVLRDFLLTHLKDYEVVVDPKEKEEERRREEEERLARQRRRSRSGSAGGGGDGGRRRRSLVQRVALRSKQSMVDDFLQQMRELAFVGFRPLKPTAEQYLSTQQPLSFSRQTVRANFNPSHTLKRSRSQLGLGHRQNSHPSGRHTVGSEEESKGGRRSERLEARNYYSVDVMYDALQRYEALHTAHIPSLSIPAPPQASHPHHHHVPARPFTIHSSSISLAYIANFSAFDSLFHLVQHSASSYIRLMALLHLQSIIASHPYNYLTLKDQHRVNLFNYLLHLLNDAACSEQLKDVASHVLGFLVSFEYYTPYAELLALVHSFQPSEDGEGKAAASPVKARKKVEEGMEVEEDESDGLASESFSLACRRPPLHRVRRRRRLHRASADAADAVRPRVPAERAAGPRPAAHLPRPRALLRAAAGHPGEGRGLPHDVRPGRGAAEECAVASPDPRAAPAAGHGHGRATRSAAPQLRAPAAVQGGHQGLRTHDPPPPQRSHPAPRHSPHGGAGGARAQVRAPQVVLARGHRRRLRQARPREGVAAGGSGGHAERQQAASASPALLRQRRLPFLHSLLHSPHLSGAQPAAVVRVRLRRQ